MKGCDSQTAFSFSSVFVIAQVFPGPQNANHIDITAAALAEREFASSPLNAIDKPRLGRTRCMYAPWRTASAQHRETTCRPSPWPVHTMIICDRRKKPYEHSSLGNAE